ncbi:MAG: aminoglycoside phosphotransferase family protein [Oscillospiraceae bacterium]|nr:aminoglycoside phosphotransferase family protein [Oscillospiraceae bacterium]
MSITRTYRDGDKFIKMFLSEDFEYLENSYKSQKFVYDAGLPVPAVYGIIKVNDTEYAIEMEYIEGKSLSEMYNSDSESERDEALRIMVKLQCQMIDIDASGQPPLTDYFKQEITATQYLTAEEKQTLLALMHSFDNGKTNLCHGDIHVYNIMYNGDKHWIIDWEDACKGDPAADACMTYFYLVRNDAKTPSKNAIVASAEKYLQLFCEKSGITRAEVLVWLPIIVGVQININDDDDRKFIRNYFDYQDRT